MLQKIKIPIKNKILTKKDIEDISNCIFKLKTREKDKFWTVVTFRNDMEISSDDLSCLESRKIEEYEIKAIRIGYRSSDYSEEVDVYIYNFDEFEHSCVEISSYNEQNLGSIEHSINELLGFCKSQSKLSSFFKPYNLWMIIFMIICIFISSYLFLVFLEKCIVEFKQYVLLTMFSFSALYFILFIKLIELYPNIEISINDKTNRIQKRRRIVASILSLIVLPLCLDIVYDVIKAFLGK